MILAIIMWCLCAFVGSIICKPKNRESEGAALGFVLGPIGVVIAMMLKPAAPKVADAPAVAAPRGRIRYNCPRCHSALLGSPDGKGTCSQCAYKIPSA